MIHNSSATSESTMADTVDDISDSGFAETIQDADGLPLLDGLSPADQMRLVQILDHYMIDVEEGRHVDTELLLAENQEIAETLQHYLRGLELIRTAANCGPGAASRLGRGAGQRSTVHLRVCPPGGDSSSTFPSADARLLGAYSLGPIIGRGAMGIVYQARDTKLDKNVAVKVLAYGTALDETRIDRFRLEAKTAATLDHPNVVPVYSVGYEHGTHYYAMQLIEGESLDRRITAAQSLDSIRKDPVGNSANVRSAAPLVGPDRYRRIAQLGASAAGALHAAHSAGIIHRDVKPSNLMLGNDGQLWVTDFGLARVQAEVGLTKTGDLVGTLRYMSPEQARGTGDLIDSRTDVYGLGTTLYELVTLTNAHAGDDVVSLLHEIQTVEPVSPRVHDPDLPRDLETIILRAIRPRPADRYPTASALAKDLQRFVEGKHICAHTISFSERAITWARQHKTLAWSLLAIWLLLMVASFTTTFFVTREQGKTIVAWKRAEQHYRQARHAVDTLGSSVAQRLSTIPAAASIRQDVLAETMSYYEQFIESSANDPSLASDVAKTRLETARLTSLIGAYSDADAAYRKAAESLASVVQQPQATMKLADVWTVRLLHARALNEWALLASEHGHQEIALRRLDEALRSLLGQPTLARKLRFQVTLTEALTHNNRGVVLMRSDAHEESKQELEQAIRLWQRVPVDVLEDQQLTSDLADAISNFSVMMSEAGNFSEAAAAAEHSIRVRGLADHGDDDAEHLSRLAIAHNNLAALQWRAGHAEQAILAYRSATDLLEQSIHRAPSQTAPRDRLAVTLNNLGMALASTGDHSEAEEVFRRAASLAKPGVDADPADVEAATRLSGIQNNLGVLLRNQGRIDEANNLLRSAMQRSRHVTNQVPGDVRTRETLQQIEANLQTLETTR